MGKSTLTIMEALSMSMNRNLIGDVVHEPCRVWLWNGEDPYEELQGRIMAACRHYEISQADIEGRLFVDSGRDTPLVIVTEGRDGVLVAEPVAAARVLVAREFEQILGNLASDVVSLKELVAA